MTSGLQWMAVLRPSNNAETKVQLQKNEYWAGPAWLALPTLPKISNRHCLCQLCLQLQPGSAPKGSKHGEGRAEGLSLPPSQELWGLRKDDDEVPGAESRARCGRGLRTCKSQLSQFPLTLAAEGMLFAPCWHAKSYKTCKCLENCSHSRRLTI